MGYRGGLLTADSSEITISHAGPDEVSTNYQDIGHISSLRIDKNGHVADIKYSTTLEEKYITWGEKCTNIPSVIDSAIIPNLGINLFALKAPSIYCNYANNPEYQETVNAEDLRIFTGSYIKPALYFSIMDDLSYRFNWDLVHTSALHKIYAFCKFNTGKNGLLEIMIKNSLDNIVYHTGAKIYNGNNIINIPFTGTFDESDFYSVDLLFSSVDNSYFIIFNILGYGIVDNAFLIDDLLFAKNGNPYAIINKHLDVSFPNYIHAQGFKIDNGKNKGFLKADGTVDNSTYLTLSASNIGSDTVPVYISNNTVNKCKKLTYTSYNHDTLNVSYFCVYTDIDIDLYDKIYLHIKCHQYYLDTTLVLTKINEEFVLNIINRLANIMYNELLNNILVDNNTNMLIFCLTTLGKNINYNIYCEAENDMYNHITTITCVYDYSHTYSPLNYSFNESFITLNTQNIKYSTVQSVDDIILPKNTVLYPVSFYYDKNDKMFKGYVVVTNNNSSLIVNPSIGITPGIVIEPSANITP